MIEFYTILRTRWGPKGIQEALGFRPFLTTAILPIRFSTPPRTSQSYVLSSGLG